MPALSIVTADPAALLIDKNIRTSAPDKTLIDSVRTHGILVPIVCINDHGQLRVRDGHRRTLAAMEAGITDVPIVVTTADDTDTDRIVAQYAINQHRVGLTPSEQVAAWSQLSAFGVPAAAIAKQTATNKRVVTAALLVADKPTVTHALDTAALTIEQGAALVDFLDDPDTVDNLIAASSNGKFEHALRDAHDERQYRADVDKLSAELQAQRIHHLQDNELGSALGLHRLRHDGQPIDEHAHTTCPGHAAKLTFRWASNPASDTPGDYQKVATTEAYCRDWSTHGHTDAWSRDGGLAKGTEQAREAERDQRRTTIANNKAATSAQAVRGQWLADFAKRRTPPKDAAAFIATTLLRQASTDSLSSYAQSRGKALAAIWLGISTADHHGIADISGINEAIEKASPARALHIALLIQLATYESSCDKELWRQWGTWPAHYLTALQSWGYGLADIEHTAINQANERANKRRL